MRNFVQSLGISQSFIGENVFNGQINAIQTGILAQEIYNFASSMYGAMLWNDLLNNQFKFISSRYETASKTGWTRGSAWHDMAIVNAKSPFILVILSNRIGWTDQDYADFAYITNIFEEFNSYWFYKDLDLSIFYNNSPLDITTKTTEELPLRQLFERMGFIVYWQEDTNMVYLLSPITFTSHGIDLRTGAVYSPTQQFLGYVNIKSHSDKTYVSISLLDMMNIRYIFDSDSMTLLIN